MATNIRKEETNLLNNVYKSQRAEFLAVYGRRRVGKTYLVRKFFSKKENYFELSGLKDILWHAGSWRLISKTQGAQIDLLFDRDDGVITLCEMKYSLNQFSIDKPYAKSLLTKLQAFEDNYKTNKQIHLALITTFGLKNNVWSEDLVTLSITMDCLFN